MEDGIGIFPLMRERERHDREGRIASKREPRVGFLTQCLVWSMAPDGFNKGGLLPYFQSVHSTEASNWQYRLTFWLRAVSLGRLIWRTYHCTFFQPHQSNPSLPNEKTNVGFSSILPSSRQHLLDPQPPPNPHTPARNRINPPNQTEPPFTLPSAPLTPHIPHAPKLFICTTFRLSQLLTAST